MERKEYRIIVNETCSTHLEYPEYIWQKIIDASEYRGGVCAVLQSRFITNDKEFYNSLSNKAGFMRVNGLYISLWQTIAEINS